MMVYHGSAQIVEHPDVMHSYRALDFGKGFYVTSVQEQAERWARRKASLTGGSAVVSQYSMKEDTAGLAVRTFSEDLTDWIDFVCNCRDEKPDWQKYDLIIGKVANDKVFRVVDLYHSGIWDRERALREIRAYPNYDQIAFVSQKAIDRLLRFECWREVS